MKELFFDQVDLLMAVYQEADDRQRKILDAVLDHVSTILYELLHPDEMEGDRDRIVLNEPVPARRVLH
jgi:hypothetical protein